MDQPNTSPKWKIDLTDLWKTTRGLLITLLAVVITAILGRISASYINWNYNVCVKEIPCINLEFIAVPVIGALLELIRRWVTDFCTDKNIGVDYIQ